MNTIQVREKRTGDIKTATLKYSSRYLTKVYHVDGLPLSDTLFAKYYSVVPEARPNQFAGFAFNFFKNVYNVPV